MAGKLRPPRESPIRNPVLNSLARDLRKVAVLNERPLTAIASVCVPIASAKYTMPGTKNETAM